MEDRNLSDPFNINVDVMSNGVEVELNVFPDNNHYEIVLDGVELTKLEYQLDVFPHWSQVDGNLDQETVSLIGDAIEGKLG